MPTKSEVKKDKESVLKDMKGEKKYGELFQLPPNIKPTNDHTVIYGTCFCHQGGGYATCCVGCKDAKPDCLKRREHNKNLT